MSNEGPGFTPHPTDPSMDLIHTSHGDIPRHQFEKMQAEKDSTPKTNVGQAKNLDRMLKQGEITEGQYMAAMSKLFKATGFDSELGVERTDYVWDANNDVEAAREAERKLQNRNEFAAAHDEYFDIKDNIQQLMDDGKPINTHSIKRLEAAIIRAGNVAERLGVHVDPQRWIDLEADLQNMKQAIRVSNGLLGHKPK